MESFKRLFKDAERIKPGEAMWNNIASRVDLPAREEREGWGWRVAASMAVGLGMLAALLVLRDPTRIAAGPGGAEDFSASQVADARAAETLPDDDLLEWHADLGVQANESFDEETAEGWADDALLLDPLTEE